MRLHIVNTQHFGCSAVPVHLWGGISLRSEGSGGASVAGGCMLVLVQCLLRWFLIGRLCEGPVFVNLCVGNRWHRPAVRLGSVIDRAESSLHPYGRRGVGVDIGPGPLHSWSGTLGRDRFRPRAPIKNTECPTKNWRINSRVACVRCQGSLPSPVRLGRYC